MLNEKVKVTGEIVSYVYEKEGNNYRIARIKTDKNKHLTIVGYFPHLEEGLSYEFVGCMKRHINYGEQLAVETYSRLNTFTVSGLIEYLSSDKFFGIGKKLATTIVDTLGTNCLNDIMKDPSILDAIPKLNKEKKDKLVQMIKDNYESERTYIRLYDFGLTIKMIERLISVYGLDAANKVEEDPYRLIYDIEGFGFKKSDSLAFNMGMSLSDPRRVKAAIGYTLNNVCFQYGFTYLTKDQLLNSAKKLLEANPNILDSDYMDAIDKMIEEGRIILDENRYFDSYLYRCEKKLAKRIKTMAVERPIDDRKRIIDTLSYIENLIKIKYTDMQKEAVINALTNKLSIITGGPGTGKSTIINAILHCYAKLNNLSLSDDEMNDRVLMAAPTGRAAKRMTEITHFKASTIHKALGYNYASEFTYNKDNQLPYNLVIIDEVSMLDVPLASTLFDAIADNTQVIFVGDSNQLPSVGPGNVLYDLMSTPYFKITRLNQIMRQSADSNIIKLSSMIQSEHIDFRLFTLKNEVYFYNSDSKNIIDNIFLILDRYLATGGDLFNDMQILIPMYAGVAGIDAVNEAIQKRYNKEEEKVLIRENKVFKCGDKVLQLKNDGKLEIMNGDIGKIVDISIGSDADKMIVNFDGRNIDYPLTGLDNLTLAYAMSIHKSQGNEFQNVIMPILPSYTTMLRKKLIYTGVTRAKKKLIILGDINSINTGVLKGDYQRQTALAQFLLSKKEEVMDNKINDKDIPFDTLGEYMMEGITPYTFMDN